MDTALQTVSLKRSLRRSSRLEMKAGGSYILTLVLTSLHNIACGAESSTQDITQWVDSLPYMDSIGHNSCSCKTA